MYIMYGIVWMYDMYDMYDYVRYIMYGIVWLMSMLTVFFFQITIRKNDSSTKNGLVHPQKKI